MLNPQTSGILTGECWRAELVPDSSVIRCSVPVCSLLISDILMLANRAKSAPFLPSPCSWKTRVTDTVLRKVRFFLELSSFGMIKSKKRSAQRLKFQENP